MSRRKEGRAGVLTNGKSWNFTYMIDQEEGGEKKARTEKKKARQWMETETRKLRIQEGSNCINWER